MAKTTDTTDPAPPAEGADPLEVALDPFGMLVRDVSERAPQEAAELLREHPIAEVVRVLEAVNPALSQQILHEMPSDRRGALLAASSEEWRAQWQRNAEYPEQSIGRLMEPAMATFAPSVSLGEAIETIRMLTRHALVTYAFVLDGEGRLVGVVTMRDLMLGRREQRIDEVMIRNPFSLSAETELTDAMRSVLTRHYPVYPVTDRGGRLVGIVRGQALFEAQAIEISAQAGAMVGVDKEERLATSFPRSFRFRHPWLQLNLLTAFLAAGVVGYFQDTMERLVILAVFLPVLTGQSANTGCQSLAITLRAMTLGELRPGRGLPLITKELLLGALNGTLVGLTAGGAMFAFALWKGQGEPLRLGLVVFLAMIGSCATTGVAGAIFPLVLRRLGADPATASSIFLTTAADVVSIGSFLGLATVLTH